MKPKAAATFKCELLKDTPNWKWLKGGNEITPSDKVEIKKDGKDLTLTIKNCLPDDVAEYAMEVEGSIYTAKLTLGGLSILLIFCLLKSFTYFTRTLAKPLPLTLLVDTKVNACQKI